jgi:ribosomal protein L37AE/L43A
MIEAVSLTQYVSSEIKRTMITVVEKKIKQFQCPNCKTQIDITHETPGSIITCKCKNVTYVPAVSKKWWHSLFKFFAALLFGFLMKVIISVTANRLDEKFNEENGKSRVGINR